MFLESQGMVEVCVEKLGLTQETIQVSVSGGKRVWHCLISFRTLYV